MKITLSIIFATLLSSVSAAPPPPGTFRHLTQDSADVASLAEECGDHPYDLSLAMENAHVSLIAIPSSADDNCKPIVIDLVGPANKHLKIIDEEEMGDSVFDEMSWFDVTTKPLNRILGAFNTAKTNQEEYDAITNNCGKVVGYMFRDLGIPVTDDMIDFVAVNVADGFVNDNGSYSEILKASPSYSTMISTVEGGSMLEIARAYVKYSIKSFNSEQESRRGRKLRRRSAF